MTEIHSGNSTESLVRLCPECGSPDVEGISQTTLVDSRTGDPPDLVKCRSCTWRGMRSDLLAQKFTHELGSDEQVLQAMVTDLRNLLAKEFAKSFGSFLLKWGFISAGVTPQELSRYIVAIARDLLRTVINTRQEIEREQYGSR